MCRQFDSSQHHRNPLKISGFSFSYTFSYTVLAISFYCELLQCIAVSARSLGSEEAVSRRLSLSPWSQMCRRCRQACAIRSPGRATPPEGWRWKLLVGRLGASRSGEHKRPTKHLPSSMFQINNNRQRLRRQSIPGPSQG